MLRVAASSELSGFPLRWEAHLSGGTGEQAATPDRRGVSVCVHGGGVSGRPELGTALTAQGVRCLSCMVRGRCYQEAGRGLREPALSFFCVSRVKTIWVGRFLEATIAVKVPWVGCELTRDSQREGGGGVGWAQERHCPDFICNWGSHLISLDSQGGSVS